MVFGKKENEWKINGLDGDEEIIEVFTSEQIIRRPTLDHSWPFYNVPFEVPKNWKKNSDWKKYKKYFEGLTNKRLVLVDYNTKNIIKNYYFSECQFLAGATFERTVKGNYTSSGGTITIMRGHEQLYVTSHIHDHLRIHQTIKHLQGFSEELSINSNQEISSVNNSFQQNNAKSISQSVETSNEDPLTILKMRFVKGEISKEDFEEMKEMLEQ